MSKGLYIHIPFCIKKCNYCDFISFSKCEKYFELYLNSLYNECLKYKGMSFDTVFIGGGTPTILSAELIEKYFTKIFSVFSIDTNSEITIEANPKTLDENKLKILKKIGINRLSIGVQSFCDSELKMLERIHNANEAIDTIKLSKKYFDNFSIDLMIGLPYQTIENIDHTLKTAFLINPKHISCYSLILENGTPLSKMIENKSLLMPTDDNDRKIYSHVVKSLKDHGYLQYEVSNFAKDGFVSRHNMKYWTGEEYLGVGVAAHSYIDSTRYSNTENLSAYLSGTDRVESERLSKDDKISEYIMLRLRLNDGISLTDFYEKFNIDFVKYYKSKIDKMIQGNFIIQNNSSIYLTDKGRDVLNSIICEFL